MLQLSFSLCCPRYSGTSWPSFACWLVIYNQSQLSDEVLLVLPVAKNGRHNYAVDIILTYAKGLSCVGSNSTMLWIRIRIIIKYSCIPILHLVYRFGRVDSVVLALHDASDIFLEIGKMSKYSCAEWMASFAFILFVLSWIILLLIYYAFWVLWSTRSVKVDAQVTSTVKLRKSFSLKIELFINIS